MNKEVLLYKLTGLENPRNITERENVIIDKCLEIINEAELNANNNPLDTLDKIVERYDDEEFLKADGFDEAIIGVDETNMRLIYSVSKCIEILMRDMSREDAMEYFSFNVSGAYVGEKTPIWCSDDFE